MRLIDADALKKRIRSAIYPSDMTTTLAVSMMETFLKDEPTVEPKRGRWVKMTGMMPPEYHGHYECSECQWHMKGLRNTWTREEEMAYCPNCGAKMEGDETDEID